MAVRNTSGIPHKSLTNNKEFYLYYREICASYKKREERAIKRESEVRSIHLEIWKVISEMYEEAEGGVYIDNLGYFCHVVNPIRSWGVKFKGAIQRMKTNGYMYNHIVLDFKGWTQPYHIYKNIIYGLNRNMMRLTPKKRYKFLINEIKSYRRCNRARRLLTLNKKNFCSRFSGPEGGV